MTVYAVHEVNDDISPAFKFGDVTYINRYYIHGDELEKDIRPSGGEWTGDWTIPAQFRINMLQAVENFEPSHDFLLIAGDHLQLLAMTAILAARYDSFMVLRYDRKLQDYIPVRLYSGIARNPTPVVASPSHIGADQNGQERRESEEHTEDRSRQDYDKALDQAAKRQEFGYFRRRPKG